jgi:hypothetical protein
MKTFLHRRPTIGGKYRQWMTGKERGASCSRREPMAIPAVASGAAAVGAFAIGALSIGALTLGAVAIARLVIGRLFVKKRRSERWRSERYELAGWKWWRAGAGNR